MHFTLNCSSPSELVREQIIHSEILGTFEKSLSEATLRYSHTFQHLSDYHLRTACLRFPCEVLWGKADSGDLTPTIWRLGPEVAFLATSSNNSVL